MSWIKKLNPFAKEEKPAEGGEAVPGMPSIPGMPSLPPELANNRPELLFGYIEGRDLFGWLDLRLGRQIQWELFVTRYAYW